MLNVENLFRLEFKKKDRFPIESVSKSSYLKIGKNSIVESERVTKHNEKVDQFDTKCNKLMHGSHGRYDTVDSPKGNKQRVRSPQIKHTLGFNLNLGGLNLKTINDKDNHFNSDSPDKNRPFAKKIDSNVTFNACVPDRLNKMDSLQLGGKGRADINNSSIKSRSHSPPKKNQVSILNYNLRLKFSDNTIVNHHDKHISEIDYSIIKNDYYKLNIAYKLNETNKPKIIEKVLSENREDYDLHINTNFTIKSDKSKYNNTLNSNYDSNQQ